MRGNHLRILNFRLADCQVGDKRFAKPFRFGSQNLETFLTPSTAWFPMWKEVFFCGLIVVMAMMLIGECCNVGSLVVDDYLVVGNGCEVYFLKFGGMQ
jgi:hypothetical protein